MTLFHRVLLHGPHLKYMIDKSNHSLEAPYVADSSICLICWRIIPARRCHPFVERVA